MDSILFHQCRDSKEIQHRKQQQQEAEGSQNPHRMRPANLPERESNSGPCQAAVEDIHTDTACGRIIHDAQVSRTKQHPNVLPQNRDIDCYNVQQTKIHVSSYTTQNGILRAGRIQQQQQ